MALRRFNLSRVIGSAAVAVALIVVLFAAASRAQGRAQGSDADAKAIKQVYAEWMRLSAGMMRMRRR
jgi:hypothetical protein